MPFGGQTNYQSALENRYNTTRSAKSLQAPASTCPASSFRKGVALTQTALPEKRQVVLVEDGMLNVALRGWFDVPIGDRLSFAGALPFLQRPMKEFDQLGGEGRVDRTGYGIEHAIMIAHHGEAVDEHGRPGGDGRRFEDRLRLLFGEHAALDPLRIERERDLVLLTQSTYYAIFALGESERRATSQICQAVSSVILAPLSISLATLPQTSIGTPTA